MHVREFSPMKESLRTCVSLLALNGVCGLFRPRALMHSLIEKRHQNILDAFQSLKFTIKYQETHIV